MNHDPLTTLTYALYLPAAGAATLAVTRLLRRHTGVFLRAGYDGDEAMATATAGLMNTQFRLTAFAVILLLLRTGDNDTGPASAAEVFEALSLKLGIILLVLGALHFLSLRAVNRVRTTGELI